MKNNIEEELKEIWMVKEELYNDYKTSNFSNYYDFIKNEIKYLNFNFFIEDSSDKKQLKKAI